MVTIVLHPIPMDIHCRDRVGVYSISLHLGPNNPNHPILQAEVIHVGPIHSYSLDVLSIGECGMCGYPMGVR